MAGAGTLSPPLVQLDRWSGTCPKKLLGRPLWKLSNGCSASGFPSLFPPFPLQGLQCPWATIKRAPFLAPVIRTTLHQDMSGFCWNNEEAGAAFPGWESQARLLLPLLSSSQSFADSQGSN